MSSVSCSSFLISSLQRACGAVGVADDLEGSDFAAFVALSEDVWDG